VHYPADAENFIKTIDEARYTLLKFAATAMYVPTNGGVYYPSSAWDSALLL
jgi:hypothetical protein